MRIRSPKLTLPVVVIAAGLSASAKADAIDGNWCSAEGLHILIKGKQVTTPSGIKMEGDYGRHDFSFIIPAAEPDAGSKMMMRLSGETRVYVSIAGKAAEPQLWKRCEEVS